MPKLQAALDCLRQSGIPVCGGCRFSDDLLIAGVRSAKRLPRSPKTVLTALFPYFTGRHEERNLALYSVIPDYHDVAGGMLAEAAERLTELFPNGSFSAFADASPIDEVTAAVRSGLGVRGVNGQLITEDYGSFVFIGEIVTDIDLAAADSPEAGCEGCMACVLACPTGALGEKGFEKSRCRSHFSQKKGALSEWEERQLQSGGLIWGCDICTLACPHNASPQKTPISAFSRDTRPLLTDENLTELMKNRAFSWRGEAVLRRNLALLQNNKGSV